MNGCVKIGNTDMYYVRFGKGPKNLIVLPGLSDGLATVKGKSMLLAPTYKKYSKNYTVYMFSRKNEMPDGYSIRDMARDQVEVLRTLGVTKFSVLGVSQGGMIAQCIAIDYPESVEKLILAVTTPYANEIVKDAVTAWIEMAKKDDHKSLMMDTAEKTYSKPYLDKNRKMFPLLAKFTKPESYERFLKNADAILHFDVRKELSKIKCPTYIIAGDDDNTVGNEAPYELNRGIEGSELYIYNGLGHGLFDEAKDFYDRVLNYCEDGSRI